MMAAKCWAGGLLVIATAAGCSAGPGPEQLDQVQEGSGGSSSSGGSGGVGNLNVVFQQGVRPTASYTGATDTTLYHDTPTPAPGSDPYCIVKGGSHPKSCLLRWDISSLPTTATVVSAELRLEILDPSVSTFQAYQLERAWSQSDANWTNATAVQLWGAPGATAVTDRGMAVIGSFLGNPVHIVSLSVDTALVQSWVTNPQSNYGIIFASPVGVNDGVSFSTAEASSFRPELTVSYH